MEIPTDIKTPLQPRAHEPWYYHSQASVDPQFAKAIRELYQLYAAKTQPAVCLEAFLEYCLMALHSTGLEPCKARVTVHDISY